jgi:hypothetical protein
MHENGFFLVALAFLLGADHIVATVERFAISCLQSAARIRDEFVRLFPQKTNFPEGFNRLRLAKKHVETAAPAGWTGNRGSSPTRRLGDALSKAAPFKNRRLRQP